MSAMINNLPVYKIVIDEADPEMGVSMMSIVERPAVDVDFMAFSSETPAVEKFSVNEEKRIIMGVALRADYPIYRRTKGECYVIFDAAVIEQLRNKFMRELRQRDVSMNHDLGVEDIYMVESFILTERHKFEDCAMLEGVAPGSWIVAYKVENDAVWERVKREDLRGFSVEMVSSLLPAEDYSKEELIYHLTYLLK